MCQICASLYAYQPECPYTGDGTGMVIREDGNAAGDSFEGTLSGPDDADWVAIELRADMHYDITLSLDDAPAGADALQSGFLEIVDARGTVVGTMSADGTLEFTATADGTYYLAVAGGSEADVDYRIDVGLSASNAGPPDATPQDLAAYLAYGYWQDQGTAWHAWSESRIDVDITGLSADGKQMARWALDVWSVFTGLDFRFVQQGGQMTFGDNQNGAFTQATFFPDPLNEMISAHVNVSRSWIDRHGNTLDSFGFSTYLHEIGHALGLGHPGDYNTSGQFPRDALFANDSWQFSVMSYFSQTDNTRVDADYAFAVTPMLADIAALQMTYGGLAPDQRGDSAYGVDGNIGGTLGMLWDNFIGHGAQHGRAFDGDTPVTMTIHDVQGRNAVNLSNDGTDQFVDLRGGGIWDVYGQTGALVLSLDTGIHDYHAGSGYNHIIGNDLGNHITGGSGGGLIDSRGGDDLITATGGDNIIWSGAGNDTVHGAGGNDTIGGGNGNDLIYGGGGNNELWGGNGNDTIHGGWGNDKVGGGRGDDLIYGGGGVNELWGGNGNDTIWGGDNGDVLGGGAGDDVIHGGAGNDTIYAREGSDQIWGGGGADEFYFYRNYDWNRINDFAFWQGDRLFLAEGLWRESGETLGTGQVAWRYGSVNEWGNVTLDFGAANTTIVLDGIDDLGRLADHIEIV